MDEFGFKIVSENNILDADPAAQRVTFDLGTGETRAPGQAEWTRSIATIELHERVPFGVRRSFAFVRGAMCYAYWYHPILTSSAHDLFRIADFATVEACRMHAMKHRTMSRRIAALIASGAIPPADENAWRTIRLERDRITHATSQAILGFAAAYKHLRTVRDLISHIDWEVTPPR